MEINQLTSGFSTGDAISNEIFELQKVFRKWGYVSEVYANPQFTSPKVRARCYDYREYEKKDSADNLMIFHFSVGSHLTDFFQNLRCKKVIIYHNITPPKYYLATDVKTSRQLAQGLKELKEFSNVPDLALADSKFNEQDLISAGYRKIGVLPLLIDFDAFNHEPDQKTMDEYSDSHTNILFVGRIVPNKKFEDVIKAFYFYQKTQNPLSRLFLVGSYNRLDRYYSYLQRLVREMNAQNVIFTGHINFSELIAYYRLAHLFICMSEHEGFCIPLLESIHSQIPIIAYGATAVRETLAGSSIIVNEKNFEEIAEMIHLVLTDKNLRENIILRQNERLKDFQRPIIESKLREYLKDSLL